MSTKNDQESIVSRKYEYELEMEVQRLNVTGLEIEGNNASGCMTTKCTHRDV